MTAAPDLHGKVCLVTGATSGTGLATAEALAGMGATTLLAARDAGRGERTRREIAAATGNQDVDVILAHLSSQAQVRRLAEGVGAPSRVVTVTSTAQSVGRIDFDDLQGERRYRGQRPPPVGGQPAAHRSRPRHRVMHGGGYMGTHPRTTVAAQSL